jgi:diguanylate cyclase
MLLRIKTKREVRLFTAAITAMTVSIPFVIAGAAISMTSVGFGADYVGPLFAIAVLIPLFLIPPIVYVVLDLIRSQSDMIRTVDSRIMFDMLTGTFNRNHFLDCMRAAQAAGPIMIVDADHFKAINDYNGHAVGDEALRIMANAIQQCVGDAGIVGRLGGEEFGVFMAGKSEIEGHVCAANICTAVRSLHPLIAGHAIKLSVSIGCAFHRPNKVIGHSLKQADDLLYKAKAEGRDQAVFIPSEGQRRTA